MKNVFSLIVLAMLALLAIGAIVQTMQAPTERELRDEGFRDCSYYRPVNAPQWADPYTECIYEGKLTRFKDTPYHY